MKSALPLLALVSGCWKTDRAELPRGSVPFEPAAMTIDDWVVTEVDVDLGCPDGRDTRFSFVHPAVLDGPMPLAVVYHSGAFDFVTDADAESPLDGAHFGSPDRLEFPWMARTLSATLGLFPSPTPNEDHTGALPAALAAQGFAMVLPGNCWGDTWHNEPGARDNVFEADRFFRSGRVAAEWPVRLFTDPAFGPAVGLEAPFEWDGETMVAVGLGEGGRAIGEVLTIAAEEGADYRFDAIAVDGLADQLGPWAQGDPQRTAGLARLFPAGAFDRGSLGALPTLPPTFFNTSSADPLVPVAANETLRARLLLDPSSEVRIESAADHLFLDDDIDLATRVAEFLAP